MNYYQFWAHDQRPGNWLAYDAVRDDVVVKQRYQAFFCPACQKFDHDSVFQEGFDANIKIRARGDIIMTDDGFCCINERLQRLINENRIRGINLKPLRNGWYVLNITLRTDALESVYDYHKPRCMVCKRWSEVTGIFQYESQICRPKEKRAFFSTVFDRHCSGSSNRDIFLTGDVAELLKHSAIKGGVLQRLFTADEEPSVKNMIQEGSIRWPPKSKILL